MALVPHPDPPEEERLLFFGTSEMATIVACAALGSALHRPMSRVFAPVWDLGALSRLPAFRQGAARTLVVGFPPPPLAWRPDKARAALAAAVELTWVTHHPVDPDVVEGAEGVEVIHVAGDPWPAVARSLGVDEAEAERFAGLFADLPDPLPDAGEADDALAWRYALEAARQEPERLGGVCRALAEPEPTPDPELVGTGRALIAERRLLARESRFHTFDVSGGTGVIVPVPRSSIGFYQDLAAEARRHRGCAVHLLCFDSHEPAVVEYAEPPVDLAARMDLARAALPDYQVLPWSRTGFAVVGKETGSLDVLEKLITVLSTELQ